MNATFLELYDKFLIFKKPNIESSSYATLEKLRGKILIYEKLKRKPLYMSEMTLEWFQQFTKGLTNGKYGRCTNSTLKLYITVINSFLNQCKVFGYAVNEDYIRHKEYMKINKVPKFDKPIILDEELATLWKFKGFKNKSEKFIPITKSKKKVIDLFVFQTQVGFRWSDIERLSRKDIILKNGKWYVNNFKTKKRKQKVSVQLNSLALNVVEKYCPKFKNMASNKPIFKYVSQVSNASHTIKWVAKKSKLNRVVEVKKGKLDKVKKYNKKIHEVISTHWARSKFATNWIVEGKDIYLLKTILGHASIKTTERYIRTLPDWIPEGVETELNENIKNIFEI